MSVSFRRVQPVPPWLVVSGLPPVVVGPGGVDCPVGWWERRAEVASAKRLTELAYNARPYECADIEPWVITWK